MNKSSATTTPRDRDQALWRSLASRVYDAPAGINGLTADEKTYFAVALFHAEQYNGGIEQFFFNSSGDYFKQVATGLKALGANQSYGLLMLAARLVFLGKVPPVSGNERFEVLASPSSKRALNSVDVLDTALLDSTENLPEMLALFAEEKGLQP